jgi:hypothetical protein
MKEVMWPLGDEEGTFDYSGETQGILISRTPTVEELERILLLRFPGREIGFDELREKTWILPFVEKHYREVLKRLDGKSVTVQRITSKQTGIKGLDRIRFQMMSGESMSANSAIEWTDATWNPVRAARRLARAANIATPKHLRSAFGELKATRMSEASIYV